MDIYKLEDVFGLTRKIPLTYIERTNVDGIFQKSLKGKKHITVFGSSKQGKTCLKKHCLKDNEYINIQCDNKMSLNDINVAILKRSGFKVEVSSKRTLNGKTKLMASLKAKIPFIDSSVGVEAEEGNTKETEVRPLELDPDDVNDIIEALKKANFHKYIVLDDFHYLKTEVQKDFSIELKAFHENSDLSFIVIGVWLDENKLITYNGDLTGRVISVNADLWNKDDLKSVIEKGEELLNIQFQNEFKEELVNSCFENVYYVQEVCHRICEANNIEETCRKKYLVPYKKGLVHELIAQVVSESAGRYRNFIEQYAAGFQDTTLEMHKWLLYPVLTADPEKLSKGLKYREIRDCLECHHPQRDKLNPGNLTQALKSVVSLQLAKQIQPIIIDYDDTNRILHIVDRGFIIWVEFSEKDYLLELAGL